MLLCSLLLFLALVGNKENTITSLTDTLHVVEGGNIKLSCNYSGSVRNLQWYRQYPRSAPKFLMLITESSEPIQNTELRMSVQVNKNDKLLHLELSSTEVTDSAVYYCALNPTVTGNSLTLYKNLTASEQLMRFSNFQTMFQSTGSSNYGDSRGRFIPNVDTSRKTGTLTITPTIGDSGIYYCAVTVRQTTVLQHGLNFNKNSSIEIYY
uniref:T-cell receptor alpha/delta variable 14.0 n=1 Tax=Paramormyrops kingsleyae TaxID=1676925 RepID=A0A3B3Q558_9TELE